MDTQAIPLVPPLRGSPRLSYTPKKNISKLCWPKRYDRARYHVPREQLLKWESKGFSLGIEAADLIPRLEFSLWLPLVTAQFGTGVSKLDTLGIPPCQIGRWLGGSGYKILIEGLSPLLRFRSSDLVYMLGKVVLQMRDIGRDDIFSFGMLLR